MLRELLAFGAQREACREITSSTTYARCLLGRHMRARVYFVSLDGRKTELVIVQYFIYCSSWGVEAPENKGRVEIFSLDPPRPCWGPVRFLHPMGRNWAPFFLCTRRSVVGALIILCPDRLSPRAFVLFFIFAIRTLVTLEVIIFGVDWRIGPNFWSFRGLYACFANSQLFYSFCWDRFLH